MHDNPYETPLEPAGGPPPRQRGTFSLKSLLLVVAIVGCLIALLLPARRNARPAARRSQCTNNLKLIALALHNYHDNYDSFPPAYTVDAQGRPLHSWRTLILPFMEQLPLYETIDLEKPWDDPANAAAFATVVEGYCCPANELPPGRTTYLAVVARDGCFCGDQARRFEEVVDARGGTLLVIEVAPEQAVPWMAPQDLDRATFLSYGPKTEFAHPGGALAALVDGTVRFLPAELSATDRSALISRAGGETIAEW